MDVARKNVSHAQFNQIVNWLNVKKEQLCKFRPQLPAVAEMASNELGFPIGIFSIRSAREIAGYKWTPIKKPRKKRNETLPDLFDSMTKHENSSVLENRLERLEKMISRCESSIKTTDNVFCYQDSCIKVIASELCNLIKSMGSQVPQILTERRFQK